jgi:hypothetical protein
LSGKKPKNETKFLLTSLIAVLALIIVIELIQFGTTALVSIFLLLTSAMIGIIFVCCLLIFEKHGKATST